ncbi:MAG: hypothetical protein M1820_001740 [Bogoriella megaspora]|nr:MAG: hypothetical protein M1820_001740 [Bogoriella megaspora]
MDPFEVRMRFTTSLNHLNASVTSAQKAAAFALRNRDMDEDLHSCILEQLEKQDPGRSHMNLRANIMYFIEHLIDQSLREDHTAYITMIQRDIPRIVDAVAPADGSGNPNIKGVRKVLLSLKSKSILSEEVVNELGKSLDEREAAFGAGDAGEENGEEEVQEGGEVVGRKGRPGERSSVSGKGMGGRVDKRAAEQRIEEDRERGKRQRESYWAVGGEEGVEWNRMLEEAVDINEDDMVLAREEREERRVMSAAAKAAVAAK